MFHAFGRLLVLFTLGAFVLAGPAVASAAATAGGRGGGGGHGGLHTGGVGASLTASRGGADSIGWGGGFHGGLARPAILPPLRTPFLRRSFAFFNVALYPSCFSYPLYLGYPAPSSFPRPYDPRAFSRPPYYPPPGLYPRARAWTPGYDDAYGNWVFGYYRYQC